MGLFKLEFAFLNNIILICQNRILKKYFLQEPSRHENNNFFTYIMAELKIEEKSDEKK